MTGVSRNVVHNVRGEQFLKSVKNTKDQGLPIGWFITHPRLRLFVRGFLEYFGYTDQQRLIYRMTASVLALSE